MMTRIAAAIALLMSVASAHAQSTYRAFQGTAFATAVTAQCAPYIAVGDYWTIVYRQKVGAADPADAMSFATGRSLFRILSTDASGGLQGSVATNNLYVNNVSNFGGGLAGAANLTITSSAGAALTAANSLKFVGPVNDFFGNVGCVTTIRAVGVLRPDL